MENDPTPDEIQRRMATMRSSLMQDVQTVQHQAQELVNWRHHFRRHPLLFCGAAATLGYLLVPRRRRVQVVHVPRETAPVVAAGATPVAQRPIVAALAGIALNVASKQASAYMARHGVEMMERFVAKRARRADVEHEVTHD